MNIENRIWGRLGFDRMIDEHKLRVGELFFVKNEQIKINANRKVIVADFSRAEALAA